MQPLPFTVLYAACLAVLLGAVQLLRRVVDLRPPPPPQPVEEVRVIAVPPRPEGVRQVQGEGEEGYRYTEAACLKLDGQYRDICYHQLARQRAPTDLDGALAACGAVAEAETAQECMADVAELHAPTDREAALAVCPTIARKKWRDQCVFGIALALVKLDPEGAFRLCSQAGQWRDFCRHDVNGEISQFDLDLAMAHCAAEEGDLLTRKSCWHGIGKYVARVDVDRAFAACAAVPSGPRNLYRENCYHGLGWGAAESAGADFAGRCDRAGDAADSCRVGVAYNVRRFDETKAMAVCEKVRRADLHDQCTRFVRDGHL